MCASIWLKFGTRIGGLKANTSIDFGVNMINIKGALYSCSMAYVFAHNSRTGGSNLENFVLLKSVINSAHFNVNIMS